MWSLTLCRIELGLLQVRSCRGWEYVPGRTSHHISVRKGDGRVLCGCRSVGGLWQVGSRPERSHM